VKEIYPVPLARPRNAFEIYLEPGFDKAYSALWHHFKSEINTGLGGAQRHEIDG
jgi:hypothetical protein